MLQSHPHKDRIRFVLSGGEPILAWTLLKETVKKIRIFFPCNPIKIQTNATLIDASKLNFLKENRIGLEIGIDGTIGSTGRHRRGVDNQTFEHIVDSILCASKLGLSVSATMTVYPDQTDFILRNYLFLSSLGLRNIDITPAAFVRWGTNDIRSFKYAYLALLSRIKVKSKVYISTSEDIERGDLSWNLSVEGDGLVLPGDVFLCLSLSKKRHFSLMRFKNGQISEATSNIEFFSGNFARLASKSPARSFSPRDYVILSFGVLRKILSPSKRKGCSVMSDLLSFLKETHKEKILS